MKNTVHFGFIAIILIMTMLAFVWLGQIKSLNENVIDLIELYDQKIDYAHTMHNTIRVRQNLLLSMLVVEDPFEKDDKLQKFYAVAANYRQARKALHSLPMSEEEEKIHKLLDEEAFIAQPINNKAAEMFHLGIDEKKIILVIHQASKYQDVLLNTLQRFVDFQKAQGKQAISFSREQFLNSIYWISFLGLFAFVIAVLISRYVERSVIENNLALEEASKNMANAFIKAEEATVIKSEFLATMSHEIRTPLTAIIGFAETTLFEEQTKAQRKNATETIIRSGKHLLQIINDILDLSKVEANKLELESVEFSPFELLAEVEKLVRPAAEEKKLGFSLNYIFPLPEQIKGDPLRLKQILINLCNNAIKFTEKGYIIINVSCDCGKDKNGIVFEVVDTGVGIKQEEQDLIFQAYRQADSSTTRKFGGTGLGLSLSKLLAEKMSGALTLFSEFGKGSKFKLFLASELLESSKVVFDKENLPNVIPVKVNEVPVGHLSGKVLLAEDNPDNQELLLIYLTRMGIDVTIVENGLLAVDAAEKDQFDLILMDMRMPVMGGREAIQLLREKGFDKPIVALTANAMQEDKDACFKAGCNSFLTKPIDGFLLNETVEKYLNIKFEKNINKDSLISSLLDENPETSSLINNFVNNFSGSLIKIERYIEQQHWDNLSDMLHQIKGTGGNFGYPDIYSVAVEMEFQIKSENTDALNNLLSDLHEVHRKMVLGLE